MHPVTFSSESRMALRDVGSTLPPGFRFYPTDEELVCHYLYKKITNQDSVKGTLLEVDLHTCEPWQLPEVAKLNSDEWYFFSFRDRKYATGYRTNRATVSGYWKATGKDRTVQDPITRTIVGMRKTLVFYRNRAPNGIKTGWIMHEFRLDNPHMPPKEDWVLCRVFHKSKGEGGDKLSHDNYTFETAAAVSVTSTSLASSSPSDKQTMPCAYHDQISSSTQTPSLKNHKLATTNANTILNLAVVNPNFLHFAQEPTHLPLNEMNSMCDDEYGFLFNMSLQDSSSLGTDAVMTPTLEEMRFDDDKTLVLY